eukprot:7383761-Prymnesium_polylepis.1
MLCGAALSRTREQRIHSTCSLSPSPAGAAPVPPLCTSSPQPLRSVCTHPRRHPRASTSQGRNAQLSLGAAAASRPGWAPHQPARRHSTAARPPPPRRLLARRGPTDCRPAASRPPQARRHRNSDGHAAPRPRGGLGLALPPPHRTARTARRRLTTRTAPSRRHLIAT